MVTPEARWEAVAHLCDAYEVSQRRACNVLSVDRSSVRYKSVRPDDAELRAPFGVLPGSAAGSAMGSSM